ncbi:MAG: HAMP domain-containing sensor histidine kinase [Flavobacteriales bacterium]|tara:strand:- start:5789 stop:7141 length:1353 start_codon:yes stop_codon:yes gene_type:complete
MKISTRLAITFSIISSVIFIAFGLTVYVLESNYRQQSFQERLKERVIITEKIFLEKESFSPIDFEKITNQFLHTLPEETKEVIRIKKNVEPVFKYKYPKEVKSDLSRNNKLEFEYSEIQGESRIFNIKGKEYIIIVSAVDHVGLKNLSFLKNIIIILALLSVPLISIGSFIIARRALLPISKKIDKANTITATNLHQRLNVHNPNDEIGNMAIAFNKLLDRLEESFEAQKAFIRNASHEIRNPLTAIMGEAEVINSRVRTTREYQKSLTTILSEAETLNLTVNNLLQLSKVNANEESINYHMLQFNDFLIEIKKSFDFLNPKNQVLLSVEKESKEFLISGNKNLLKTAILNLFDNACKFSSNNEVEVLLKKDKNWLILSVKDIGIGIENNDIEKVVTPFYRGNNVVNIKGSGIGLSLTSKIINLHEGVLEINSEIGIGTEIQVILPLILS